MNARVQLVGGDRTAAVELAGSLATTLHTAGFGVELCSGTEEARRWLDETGDGPVAVVLAFGRHPDLAALALCRELRRVAPRVVVVAIGSAVTSGQVVAALEAGADDHVARPCHPQEVVARLRAHLRRLTAENGPPRRRPVPTRRADPVDPGRAATGRNRR